MMLGSIPKADLEAIKTLAKMYILDKAGVEQFSKALDLQYTERPHEHVTFAAQPNAIRFDMDCDGNNKLVLRVETAGSFTNRRANLSWDQTGDLLRWIGQWKDYADKRQQTEIQRLVSR